MNVLRKRLIKIHFITCNDEIESYERASNVVVDVRTISFAGEMKTVRSF